jgi:CBS domain containing-hemolysin-like protein
MTGALDHEQSEMIRNVLEFGDVTAHDVMVPRTQRRRLCRGDARSTRCCKVADAAHSRYPVYRDTVDNVIGVLHAKDLSHAVARARRDRARTDLEAVAFVPESQTAASVLKTCAPDATTWRS